MPKKIDRTGEHFITNEGYEIVIIKYNGVHDVWIQFQDEHKTIRKGIDYKQCKNGGIENPFHPSVCGVGYIGVGNYTKIDNKKCYETWCNMLKRCYDKEVQKRLPTYKDCFANKETYCFQDFAKWFDENYYEIEGETMCLDKDILCKGNKEYSFNTMIFVPNRINTLFIKCNATRGSLPIGVTYNKRDKVYTSQCSILTNNGHKLKHLGNYNNINDAFQAYKIFKEQYIKQVADEYKDCIPYRLYEAMYKWEVEIDD